MSFQIPPLSPIPTFATTFLPTNQSDKSSAHTRNASLECIDSVLQVHLPAEDEIGELVTGALSSRSNTPFTDNESAGSPSPWPYSLSSRLSLCVSRSDFEESHLILLSPRQHRFEPLLTSMQALRIEKDERLVLAQIDANRFYPKHRFAAKIAEQSFSANRANQCMTEKSEEPKPKPLKLKLNLDKMDLTDEMNPAASIRTFSVDEGSCDILDTENISPESEIGGGYEGIIASLKVKKSLELDETTLAITQKILNEDELPWLDQVHHAIEQFKIESNPLLKQLMQPLSTKSGERGSSKSGSYFIFTARKVHLASEQFIKQCIAVFKPREQELGTKYGHKSLAIARYGIAPGDGVVREQWASILLPNFGPTTTLTTLYSTAFSPSGRGIEGVDKTEYRKPKIDWTGALQRFVPNAKDLNKLTTQEYLNEIGSFPNDWKGEILNPENILSNFVVDQIHRLAIGDLSLGNTDRNRGNVLMQIDAAGNITLVPIDHGCIMCAGFEDIVSLCWMKWPGAHTPISPANTQWILTQLAAQKERREMIRKIYPQLNDSEFARIMQTNHVWQAILRAGIEAKLTPYQIGSFFMFKDTSKSIGELIFEAASTQPAEFSNTVETLACQSVATIKKAYQELSQGKRKTLFSTDIHSLLFNELCPAG